MRFKVSIGYKEFMFDDELKAMSFARTAKETMVDDRDYRNEVVIEFINAGEEKEEK